jgi:membrane-bound lytic murein transglycosylase D
LAIVESALNPKAVSKMGATGLWQFMYQTGKQYGLKIDYIDERSDPLRASDAAAQYIICIKCLAIGIWFWRPIILVQAM